jgi:uncharacterized membrane protein YraQ (UPF0718 family)
MSFEEYKVPTYPVVQFLVSRGKLVSLLLAALLPLAGIALAFCGWGVWPVIGGVVGGLVLGAVLLSYIEVLQIIADTLIPK